MEKSLLRANSRQDLELERYFRKIKASCARKTIVTVFDMLWIMAINLPLFVLFAYYYPEKGFLDAFHQLVEKKPQIEAWRMFAFSVWTCFFLYIYFVLVPSRTKYQTFFSNYFGMKAVTLDDTLNWKGKLSQAKLFRANLIPVFSIPIMCAIFFYGAWITNNNDWYESLIQNGFRVFNGKPAQRTAQYWIYGMRMIMVIVFFLQIHHLFTVGASTKALNWFTKSNRIIYVNVEKALVVMSTEDKPTPNKENMFDLAIPGTQRIKDKKKQEEYEEEEEEVEKIDFSQDIELSTDEFLEDLRKLQETKLAREKKNK